MTSLDTLGPDAALWDGLWGGPEGGSWARTRLRPDRALVAADDANTVLALQDLVNNVYGKVPNGNMSAYYDAYAYINTDGFTAKFAILTTAIAYVQVFFGKDAKGGGDRSTPAWAQAARARAECNYLDRPKGGHRIPAGLEPTVLSDGITPDSDGTLEIYEPNWTWPGRAGSYPGRYTAFFGVISPSQNIDIGRVERWTTKYSGVIPAARTDLRCRSYNSPTASGDYASTAQPEFVAPPVATPIAGYETTTFTGWGREGLRVELNAMPTAVHIPLSHTLVTKRDLSRTDPDMGHQGYIDHPLGFMMFPAPTQWKLAPRNVWPATSYDGASRYFNPQGTMWRLPPDWIIDPALSWQQKMLEKCWRDYGLVFNDTTGSTGITLRAEAGSTSLWSFGTAPGGSKNGLMRALPWASLRRLVPGTDSAQHPTGAVGGGGTTAPPVVPVGATLPMSWALLAPAATTPPVTPTRRASIGRIRGV